MGAHSVFALLQLLCISASMPSQTDLVIGPPPLFNITATSLYAAGREHGRLAASRIKGWLDADEMSNVIAFTRGRGLQAFEQLKRVNAAIYPHYVDEMRGIADGADIALDSVWALNMVAELEALMRMKSAGHCSDIYAVDSFGRFSHGHNEDWAGCAKDFFYFVKYTAAPNARFNSCAGLVYPGSIVGWAPTWNSHGMYLTQNSLFPIENTPDGVASIFAQREAICGESGDKGLNAIIKELTRHNWSSGASVNLVDITAGDMANVEVHEERHSVFQVSMGSKSATNYSHFNMYKHLEPGKLDPLQASSLHRQARVNALPPARTRLDIMERLGDSHDSNFPIFRNITLTTMVLDGFTARLDVWCCSHSAASGTPPVYTWDVLSFFNETSHDNVVSMELHV